MQPIICRGCREHLPSHCSGINIFRDDTSVNLSENGKDYDKPNSDEPVKLYLIIELITGRPVSKMDGLPSNLCEECYKKFQAFVSFRTQLLTSVKILLGTDDERDAPISSVENKNEPNETGNPDSHPDTDNKPITNDGFIKDENPLCLRTSESKPVSDDSINVDENSTPLDFNNSVNSETGLNGSFNSNLSNDRENNNFCESTSSSDNTETLSNGEVFLRARDNDMESEIDVCSGEDDEVFELDVQSKKDEIVEIESSSESDIEVCDYEPVGKRLKNYTALSSPIYF